ncbi:SDR family NAD(P)-dependent oxidoreductase [Sphingomonas sp. ASV193]|uniref:SDR family NAD(P)-dependent oxidoreductase n=1 Tax=Sphingomonas sp. ASV193 TaxID=3144405 RepID=UPI0032E8F668
MTEGSRKVALVTGAESGIGAASAAALAAAGHDLAVLYFRDGDAAAKTVAAVEQAGGRAVAIQCDVSAEASVEAAFDQAIAALGVPSVLVNSAGINQSGVAVEKMGFDQWKRMFGADLDGAFLTSRRLVRELAKTPMAGRIINVSSIHGFAMRAGAADYCAAKGALDNLTQVLSLEVAARGITVNAIAPGMILTPMNEKAVDDVAYRQSLEHNIPAQRAGTATEVASLVAYLASDQAAYITGAILTIDGGLSLQLGQGA